MATNELVSVNILGRDYRLSCAPGERDALLAAVALVDEKMQAVRSSSKVMSNDRIAVLAALNIANELLALRMSGDSPTDAGARTAPTPSASPAPRADAVAKSDLAIEEFQRRIQSINTVLDKALAPQEKLF